MASFLFDPWNLGTWLILLTVGLVGAYIELTLRCKKLSQRFDDL
jgi:hypothetical protein